jgi:hypothetical protein
VYLGSRAPVSGFHRTLSPPGLLLFATTPSAVLLLQTYKRGVLKTIPLVDFHPHVRLLRPQRHLFITLSWSLKWNPHLRQVSKKNGETSTEGDSDDWWPTEVKSFRKELLSRVQGARSEDLELIVCSTANRPR